MVRVVDNVVHCAICNCNLTYDRSDVLLVCDSLCSFLAIRCPVCGSAVNVPAWAGTKGGEICEIEFRDNDYKWPRISGVRSSSSTSTNND